MVRRGQLNTLVTLSPWEEYWYPLNKRLGGRQSWSGCFGKKNNLLSLPGIEPHNVQPVALSLHWLQTNANAKVFSNASFKQHQKRLHICQAKVKKCGEEHKHKELCHDDWKAAAYWYEFRFQENKSDLQNSCLPAHTLYVSIKSIQ